MTLFPAGIEIFKDPRLNPASDPFSQARLALHKKLVRLSDAEAINAIPRDDLFQQVGIVVDELLEFETFTLTPEEQTVLSRVLAYDLMAAKGRKQMISRMIN